MFASASFAAAVVTPITHVSPALKGTVLMIAIPRTPDTALFTP